MKPTTKFYNYFFSLLLGLNCISISAQATKAERNPSQDSTVVNQSDFKGNSLQGYSAHYYLIRHRNQIKNQSDVKINRETPQACLENFILNARKGDYRLASYSLNLNLVPENVSQEQVEELVHKLFILVNQNINIDWDKLPDRPDGQVVDVTGNNKAAVQTPRKSIAFGTLDLDGRGITLRIQRIKYREESPYWVISANTVENIDELYAVYGPNNLVQLIPDWGWKIKFLGIPSWKVIGLFLCFGVAYLFGWLTVFILRRIFGQSKWRGISSISFRLALPASLFIGMVVFYILLDNLISFNGDYAHSFYSLLLIITIAFGTWFVMRFLDAFISFLAENRTEDIYAEENLESRRILTHLSVARRIVTFVILLIGAGIIFSQFESFRNLGVSLFASAGVATVIVGIAAQSTLGNIIAGIQIAVTKPAQIGDLVILDDQWGHVEDIGFVFMIIKTWDDRRIVMPLKKIISNSFENWSMRGSSQIRSIDIYVDYQIDIQKIRSKYEELLKDSPNWNKKKQPSVQVVEATEKSIKIRALCSANDPFLAWDLQCDLREKLIAYIGELEDGLHLSKTRLSLRSKI